MDNAITLDIISDEKYKQTKTTLKAHINLLGYCTLWKSSRLILHTTPMKTLFLVTNLDEIQIPINREYH